MRRKDREVLDANVIESIIKKAKIMHLGMNDNGSVYVLPLNYGYTYQDDKYTFYIHSAKEGRKIDILKANPAIGFEIDIENELVTADVACEYSQLYQSVVGNGCVTLIDDTTDKKYGLEKIMEHQTGKSNWKYSDEILERVCIIKVEVSELTGKEHI